MKLRFCPLLPLSLLAIACGNVPNASEVIASPTLDASLPSDCMALQTCCPTLPSEVVTSCGALASQASDTQCGKEVSALQASGRCLTTPSKKDASSDGSSRSTGGADAGAVGCILLSACCTSQRLMASQATTCNDAVGAGNDANCESLFASLTGSQQCSDEPLGMTAAGGGCPALSNCCGSQSLPTSDITTCDEAVSSGDDTACTQMFDTFATAGYCGSSVALPDGGQLNLPTPGCKMLSMCCEEATFPEGTQSTCNSIAVANDDARCVSAYDSYSDALCYCDCTP